MSVERRRVACLLLRDEPQRAADAFDGVERVAGERLDAAAGPLDRRPARAERVGATFACESKPGKGTSIDVGLGPVALAELQAAAAMGETTTIEPSTVETPSIRDG